MELVHSGKVRDLYADGDDIILVASDRVSVYDVILPTPIPDKGKILTQLSLWWFGQLADVVPNHVVSASDVPPEWAGRAIRCRRLEMIPVECIARGYLAGLGLASYRESGTISGVRAALRPAGGREVARARVHAHDQGRRRPRRAAHATRNRREVGAGNGRRPEADHAGDLPPGRQIWRRNVASSSPTRNWNSAARRMGPSSSPTRCSRPTRRDSGRLLPGRPGRPQHSLDKQFLRDWSATLDWDRTPPGPPIPGDIVDATGARYVDVYERLTGESWKA